MSMSRRDFLATSAAAAIVPVRQRPGRIYVLEDQPAGKTLRGPDGQVVLSYLTAKPEGVPLAGNNVCCVHPLNTPGGESATDIAPADHRDHRGIFFAWHDMSFARGADVLKGDFWGWGRFAPTAGRVITNREVRLASATNQHAELAVTNDWTIDDRVVLRERTTLETREVTDGGRAARVLDLTFILTSDFDVTLNQMAFTGFCFRCRKDGAYTFTDPNGEVTLPNSSATNPETDWPSREWYAHTVTRPGGGTVTSAVIDHPQNPTSRWHGARSVSFLNPCITTSAPLTIPAGRPLTLRYRALTLDGSVPTDWLNRLARTWHG